MWPQWSEKDSFASYLERENSLQLDVLKLILLYDILLFWENQEEKSLTFSEALLAL